MGNKDYFAVMVEGMQTPSKVYSTYDEAEAEAKRLTLKERKTTYVLKAVAICALKEVEVTKL